jgi:hypothetical protein
MTEPPPVMVSQKPLWQDGHGGRWWVDWTWRR